MVVVGLIGHEYDPCVKLLKTAIEDRGHTARIINLALLPRVVRVSIDLERLVFDGDDLLKMDGFYLRDLVIREPFFHVTYSRELWSMLRQRYLAFIASEADSILFGLSLLEILAANKPMINTPTVYARRTLLPYHWHRLARDGIAVPSFTATLVEEESVAGTEERLPISFDEEKTFDVLTFPKRQVTGVRVRRSRRPGMTYRVIFVADRFLKRGLCVSDADTPPAVLPLSDVPAEVVNTALRAVGATEAAFAEVWLSRSDENGVVRVSRVDPSPDFSMWDKKHGVSVSGPLAQYLIDAAVQYRAVG